MGEWGKRWLRLAFFIGVYGGVGVYGGERARLTLALIVWQRPNVLILDEPTNHLDLDMRNALMLALGAYQGALILVSHDRDLITTVCDSLVLVAHGTHSVWRTWVYDLCHFGTEKRARQNGHA